MKYKITEDGKGTITDKNGKRFKINKIEQNIDIDKFINIFLIVVDLIAIIILLFVILLVIGIIVGKVELFNIM